MSFTTFQNERMVPLSLKRNYVVQEIWKRTKEKGQWYNDITIYCLDELLSIDEFLHQCCKTHRSTVGLENLIDVGS